MTIASIKFFELAKHLQKMKGRIVYRGDCAKDEHGSAAVYQELGANPTSVQGLNACVAYGSLPGNCSTAADAIKAYVQAYLKGKRKTWIELPPELRPAWWKTKFVKPVVLLIKALYGHPDAGGLWEAHLKRVLHNLGGSEVVEFPGNFYFPDTKLLLSTYVDDLTLAGPIDQHQPFWEKLTALVDVEPPEPIYRVLGRNHSIVDLPWQQVAAEGATSNNDSFKPTPNKPTSHMVFDMYDYALQTVEFYKSITGIDKIKPAATPFVPEGSILEQDEAADIFTKALPPQKWGAALNLLGTFEQSFSMNEFFGALICCSRGTVAAKAAALFDLYAYMDPKGDEELYHRVPSNYVARTTARPEENPEVPFRIMAPPNPEGADSKRESALRYKAFADMESQGLSTLSSSGGAKTSRSKARRLLKSFVAKPRAKKVTRALRLVGILERHHPRPCYDSVRRAIRGLGMSTWNNSWKGNYWGGGGRKKIPKPQQPKRKAEKPHDELPAYDSDRWASSSTLSSSSRPSQPAGQPSVSDLTKLLKSIVETGQLELPEEAKALLAAQAETDAKEDIQQEQRLLNAKRKAHGKILRLKDALERKKEKFQVYKAALKEQLAKETDRFQQDVEGINKAILETEAQLAQLEEGNMGDKDQPAETMEIELDHRDQGESWATCKTGPCREGETGDGRQVRSHELAVDCHADAISASRPEPILEKTPRWK
eukprot:symbB.v1.2.007178.t1/scaffold436.1/size343649/10